MRSSLPVASLVASIVVLAGCSSAPKVAPPPPVVKAGPTAPQAPMPMAKTGPAANAVARPAYLDPNSAIYRQRSVFFAFDNFSIQPQYDALVRLQGDYLRQNPKLHIRVEGNTDERGGSEYNLALGQKRAHAVAKALAIYGANPMQMEEVSWGKEKPVATGHDEAAWSQNRRADLVYPSN